MHLGLPDNGKELDFKFSLTPRWSDIDGFGVAHHTTLLRYLEEARLELFRARSYTLSALTNRGISVAVVELVARYRKAVRHGDDLVVEVGIAVVRSRSADLLYRVLDKTSETVLVAATRLVCIDGIAGTMIRLPEDLRDALANQR